ncbi:MAG: peptidyl-prolyl cis-trans isomerase [Acidobacteriota bacterium]
MKAERAGELRGRRRRCLLFRTPVLIFGALSLLACGGARSANPGLAVSISGEQLPYSDFEKYLRTQLDSRALDLDDAALSGLFDQYLEGQLLTRMAEERGLIEGPLDSRRAAAFLLRDLRFEPGETELRAYYAAHRSDFASPKQVRLRLILVPERELAEQALEALYDQDFAEVAARFSQGPTAHLGGDQGLLAREDLPARFADIIFALPTDGVSEIVQADYGYQIFQVTERRPALSMSFEEALPRIRRELLDRHIDEQLAALLEEARERYNVRIYRSNLPFAYRSPADADAGDSSGEPAGEPREDDTLDATSDS